MMISSYIAQVEPRSLGASEPRSLGASEPKGIPMYVYRITSHKNLIYSMKTLKPAIATTASAGIRRMEPDQPSALRMRTCGGKGVLANGCANSEHPKDKFSA